MKKHLYSKRVKDVEAFRLLNAHRMGAQFIVRADEILTAFMELETAIHEFAVSLLS